MCLFGVHRDSITLMFFQGIRECFTFSDIYINRNDTTNALLETAGAAGFLVSGNRILTKLLLDDPKINTIIFFIMSIGIVALCFFLHQVVWRTDFVQFYITLCRESRKIVLEPTEDVGLVIPIHIYCNLTLNCYPNFTWFTWFWCTRWLRCPHNYKLNHGSKILWYVSNK
jgi:hypothetical protein